MASFFSGCSCDSPSLAGAGVDVVLSSARMVSSFDSTPARKDPHLEVTFDVVGGDAISTTNVRLVQCPLIQTHAWWFGALVDVDGWVNGRAGLGTWSVCLRHVDWQADRRSMLGLARHVALGALYGMNCTEKEKVNESVY